jgi:integrase
MPRRNLGPRLNFRAERGVYSIDWSEGGATRRRSTGTGDIGEAQRIFAEFLAERQRAARPSGPCHPSEFPIAEALTLYGAGHAPETAAPARIGYAIDALLTFWADNMVGDISKETCRAYLRHRARADGTVRRELGTLRAAIKYAHGEGRLTHVPAVHLPAKPEGRDRWLTRSEAAALLNAARTARSDVRLYLPLFIVLALYSGQRKEAILSLRWTQVDFERGHINFNPPGRKRTSKGRAHIPIPARLMTFLRLARKRGSDLGFVVHDSGARIKDIGGAWAGTEDKKPQGSFGSACQRAGLPNVSPHVLRHTCGTWMAQHGVDLWQIAGWLGQTHARTTELYAHHHPDHLAEAKRAADRRRA